jgi:hypothetical protein
MKALRAVAGGLAGLSACLAIVKLTQLLRAVANFPAFAGEDDFALRAAVFFLVVLPAFALLGGWIALAPLRGEALRMLAGSAAATLASFALLALARGPVERLSSSSSANAAALSFLIGWPLLCSLGAYLARANSRRGERTGSATDPGS